MICNSKAFVDIAPAGRHRGLSTIYIRHNLSHRSKLGRDVELQRTHNVLFESPRDVMQVSTLSAHLGLGSELVDWYPDATAVPYGHLLIDLSPRPDDRLRYCTNTGSMPSKFLIKDQLKQSKLSDDEYINPLYSFSHKRKNLFLQSCPKEFIRFLCVCIVNFLKEKPAEPRKNHVTKFHYTV